LQVFLIRRVGSAFIKTHHDVGTQSFLDLYRPFRRKKVTSTVQMGLEGYPFLTDLPGRRQTENLVTTTVREKRAMPVHESVQPSKIPYQIRPWPQPEMVGIGEQDPSAERVQIFRSKPFYRALCPYRHEHRGGHYTMCRPYLSQAGSACILFPEVKLHNKYYSMNMALP
jgi:hypothetical protein